MIYDIVKAYNSMILIDYCFNIGGFLSRSHVAHFDFTSARRQIPYVIYRCREYYISHNRLHYGRISGIIDFRRLSSPDYIQLTYR